MLNESELYKKLGLLTKDKSKWEESIPFVSSLLDHESVKIQAKALWLLGEMGFVYPRSLQDAVPSIVPFLDSREPLLRERPSMLSAGLDGAAIKLSNRTGRICSVLPTMKSQRSG